MFITFEGIEGSGKSTQARRLAEELGPAALLTREPGGTALGQAVRRLLLDEGDVAAEAEVLLFLADRAQHVAEVVKPALRSGRIVLSERYLDSTYAYQGHGRGLPLDLLRAATELATGGLLPDLTLFFDVPVPLGLARVAQRGGQDRLEGETREFHERTRLGYETLMRDDPDRWLRIDASRSSEEVWVGMRAALAARGVLNALR
jgi:dTMP kinase